MLPESARAELLFRGWHPGTSEIRFCPCDWASHFGWHPEREVVCSSQTHPPGRIHGAPTSEWGLETHFDKQNYPVFRGWLCHLCASRASFSFYHFIVIFFFFLTTPTKLLVQFEPNSRAALPQAWWRGGSSGRCCFLVYKASWLATAAANTANPRDSNFGASSTLELVAPFK